MNEVAERFRHGGKKPRERREQPEHLNSKQNHDGARKKRENAVDLRRERQRRTERPDRAAQQRVRYDAPGIEIDMRLEPLQR